MDDIDARFVIHHVGGRGGSMPFRVPLVFQDSVVIVRYDADPDCLDQIRENAEARASETHVFPYFLGSRAGRSIIHINYDPHTSSVGELDPRYAKFYMPSNNHDYIIGDVFKTIKSR